MDNPSNYILQGKTLPLHDIREKVTGKIKYTGDMEMPGMVYGNLILSSIPHGKIKDIDISKAKALPGVIEIFTYQNSPDTKYNSHQWYVGQELVKDEVLFTQEVRFVGDRIGAVVAKDQETAEQAVDLIEIIYEEQPALIHPEKAYGSIGYQIGSKEIRCGESEKEMEAAPFVVEDRVETQKVHHGAMETHVCLAAIDSYGKITIWTPCQVVYQVRLLVAEILELPLNKVRVIKTPTGGSFGGKGQPVLEPITAFLAHALGVPVKLQLDRRGSIIGTRTRTATIGKVKTAVDGDGNILARDIQMLVDTGAYYTNAMAVTLAMGKKAFRLYDIKHQRFVGKMVYTNTPIGGACRGYGSPQIHALTEINLDSVARVLKMNPLDLRLRNLVHPYDKDPVGGPDLGNARIIDCVIQGAEVFRWRERWGRAKDKDRYARGIGMACATHGNGYHGAYPDFITMTLRMNEDGEIFLNGALHDLGCGTIVSIKQIVAEVLDIEIGKIYAPEGDTEVSPYDSAGTQASRVTFVCGGCARKVAEMAKGKFIAFAARILQCKQSEVRMEDGMIWRETNEGNKLKYGEMILKIQHQFQEDIFVSHTYQSPGNPASYGVNFVEVEVDTYTGLIKVVEALAVYDIGKAINRGFVEGQIRGAIQMGIGLALSEEIHVDGKGRITGDSLSKYHMINAPDMPDVDILLVEEGEELGPFGAKSIGEISTVPITPAVINAINHALDTRITSLPATPEKVLAAIMGKRTIE
ncbi:xanthine dehydrogenase molybdenum-binding subunit [Anaerosolibacter carboniphilus]|uniref:Xanthine dehydrogenase molybdenum-binding subunit n=1 Tax=Anaerosolibacter carboniphilus TaxID=1417629 RepID=A0A841KZJ3_9FIRM|nr:molybdopterin cofactor-binding domain-containing protein [Anaerosolibacter carboniphilus]MBB6218921.1 xanthine dehydrogenase molybdenum-binding subunit [Anaerosolibacter carboniphilus]